ncbi:MAG: molecular chaperone HtpG [bacterium]|nr:molecular chaperone HtpG [bacterium]
MTTTTETHAFEAEVQEVLSLVIHSLYSNKEIFLRELISNGCDALDKLRFEALTSSDLLAEGESLGIALDLDPEAGRISIADNGIGMSHDELVANLGTIASSGTRRFLEQLKQKGSEGAPDLIGQFGVGFYSAFMVADEVTVQTRRAGSDEGWCWTSIGDGQYSIAPADDLPRGTLITLKLRSEGEGDDGESKPSDLLQEWRVREIVKRYSDFVEYPIQMEVERTEPKLDDEGKPIEGAEPETVTKLETLNSMKPLWARPKGEIEEAEYEEFYKHLAHDWNAPLETVHFNVEGTFEYTALLFVPKDRPFDLFDPSRSQSSVSLYVRRVQIMRDCEDLLPGWLRFVRGVVESNDLPLNVSRETLQDNPKVRQIKKRLVKKVLESLAALLAGEREKYEGFWKAFGAVLKEGIYYGEDEDQRISKLCLFESTHGEGTTTLAEYVERMPEGQEAIYTIAGTNRTTAESSPHLEALRERGYEVLFLLDPVDEWMAQRLTEFDGKPLKSVEKGEVEFEDEDEKKAREEKQESHKGLLESLQNALSEDVQEVRFSARLKDSPAVLVADPQGMTAHMEALLRRSGQDVPKQKRILEVNPEHALVAGLKGLYDVDPASTRIAEYGELLFGQALIAEGSTVPDPGRFAKLLTELMVGAVRG